MGCNANKEGVEKILTLLKGGSASTVVLAGKPGVGKTWMAKKVSVLAVRRKVVEICVWLCLSIKYDKRALYEHVARQLSLLDTLMEWENSSEHDNAEAEETVDKEESLGDLKEKIQARLLLNGARHGVLVILDDEGNKMTAGDKEINSLLQFIQDNLPSGYGNRKCKVLITSLNKDGMHQNKPGKEVIHVMHLTPAMSMSILRKKAGEDIFNIPGIETSVRDFMDKKGGLTHRELGLVAKLLGHHKQDSKIQNLEDAFEKALYKENIISLLIGCLCDKVPVSVLIDLFLEGNDYFHGHGSIHYSELILYWILEGYVDPMNCLENAYEEGHRILTELIDCQLLEKPADNYLITEKAKAHLKDHLYSRRSGAGNLGLANVFLDDYKGKGIGEVAQMDGAIRSLGCRLLTLLIDGNSLSLKNLHDILQINQDMQILGLLGHGIESLPRPLSVLEKLHVLVLRDCYFLRDINDIKNLKTLTVLEVSGSRSLKRINDDVFLQLTQLRSINLSDLQIEQLPKSVSELTDLRWLVLKDCSHLKQLCSLRKCGRLKVLDLSGASLLSNIPGKNLKYLPKLQMLNISRTQIKCLPILQQNIELTHLSASGCQNIDRLPCIRNLTNLQALDLSWSSVKEFNDKSLQNNKSLKILDLSKTSIASAMLPSNISNPCEFYLRCCLEIERITFTESPSNLEILDFSGSCNLTVIEARFFEHLEHLRILNLKKTKVKVLPPLDAMRNLRELLLSDCLDLVKLPALSSLTKLEVLDLSNCEALMTIEDDSFNHLSSLRLLFLQKTKVERVPELKSLTKLEELYLGGINALITADFLEHMCNLRRLDLAETSVKQLPSLSNLKSLTFLCLQGCMQLESLPSLDECLKLEVLDLSKTAVRQLPSLEKLHDLRKLLLNDCSNLEEFANIKAFDSCWSIVQELPHGISNLTRLMHVTLPNVKNMQAVDRTLMKREQEDMKEYQWAICNLSDIAPDRNESLMTASGSEFLELLESNPSLWNISFNHFHFFIHPIDEQNSSAGLYKYKDELIPRDVYLLSRHGLKLREQGWSVELHNFRTSPVGIEAVLVHTEHIFLFNDSFIKSLADLGASNLKKLKGCWIEGCHNMQCVVDVDSVVDPTELVKELEILWISNASLSSLFSKMTPSCDFPNLKCLYLYCCPKLSRVLVSTNSLPNLATLNITFCEKLDSLFGHDREDHVLPKLRMLHLWELPELKGIGCMMPSLQFLEVGECPMLKHVLPSNDFPKNLEILKVRNCQNMSSLLEGINSRNSEFLHLREMQLVCLPSLRSLGLEVPSLQRLEVGYCPLLVHILSLNYLPENLLSLKVRYCDNLHILFEGITSENRTLQKLHALQLWGLPKLLSIGFARPPVKNFTIGECPVLSLAP